MMKAALASECRRTETAAENIGLILESVGEAAERLEKSKCEGGVKGTKECFKKLLETQAQLTALKKVMKDLERTYTTPENDTETDFKVILEEASQGELHRQNFVAEEDALYIKLLAAIKEVQSDDEEPVNEDDDLQIDPSSRSLAPNITCPLSGVELLDLKDPVQDQKGFVYEHESITAYIRRAATGNVPAPTVGAKHSVSVADLRPAKKVIKAQRKARNQPSQTQRPDEGDILDIA